MHCEFQKLRYVGRGIAKASSIGAVGREAATNAAGIARSCGSGACGRFLMDGQAEVYIATSRRCHFTIAITLTVLEISVR